MMDCFALAVNFLCFFNQLQTASARNDEASFVGIPQLYNVRELIRGAYQAFLLKTNFPV